ncbi:MAG: ABC transporter ATP-binding protein, partial [Chloroflexi bacterium]|nr:ABC transporter ATP-binding protein [Chloroflexota bacterium]
MTTLASVRGLSFWYPHADRPALRDVDLDVRIGELLVLCGPSGGGKSTLLRLLQGIVPQRSGGDLVGEATALDRDVTRTPPHALAAAGVTLLYQNPLESFVAERVSDEVAFGPESLGLARAEIAARVREALADVGLEGFAARQLSALSGGEQQRVTLAAALALRPRLLLLDEPTAHLDEASAIAILDLVDHVRRVRGTTVVLAEHRLGAVAARADRLA